MERKQELLNAIAELEAQKKPFQNELNQIWKIEEDQVQEKIKRCAKMEDKFSLDDLVFSAGARCSCGAGMAYPKNIGIHSAWHCSDILLGRAIPSSQEGAKTHHGALPFAFYEIKSENQPSANGQTTRPKE